MKSAESGRARSTEPVKIVENHERAAFSVRRRGFGIVCIPAARSAMGNTTWCLKRSRTFCPAHGSSSLQGMHAPKEKNART